MSKKRLLVRIIFIPLLFLLTGIVANAQNKTISGKVTDSKDGSPVVGASVIPRGLAKGTTTGVDGSFRISVPAQTTVLVISSVGFGTQLINISGDFIAVSLTATNAALSEVVVIGYGTVKKKDLTGAVATVTSKDFQKGSISTPEQMIAGKVPGVSIISNGGQPGSGSTIRIRGGSSLNASNDPLIVIDGVPLDNDGISGAGNALSFINANDIESFSILKDASAAAIYGTRAANGVIIITTKRGRGGAFKVNFSSVNSASSIVKQVDVLNANQIRSIVNANGTTAQKALLGAANTNWQDQIYQTAFGTDNNISFNGGIKNLPYRISVGYQNLNGILKTDNLQKTSVAFVLNPTFLNNHLKVDLNLKASTENTRFANTDAIGGSVGFDPTQPVYVKSQRFGGYFEWLDPSSATGLSNVGGKNPVGLLNQTYNKSKPQRSIGNLQIDYEFHFLSGLHANLNLGYDVSKGAGTVFISDSAASAYVAGGKGGQNNQYKQTKQNTLIDFYLSYTKDIKSIKSHVDVLAGHSYNDYFTEVYNYASYYANGTKVPNSDPPYPFDKPEHNLESYFGRFNYYYDDRYLFTATFRSDRSSRFPSNNRVAFFPSVALAWKIKNEGFLRNSNTISDLKLRLGYGITGQQDGIANYSYQSVYSLSTATAAYQFGDNYYQGYRPAGYNPNLKWEQTATSNIALDYGFVNNRITGSVDFYLKKTKDLLNNVPVPAGNGFSAYQVKNVGNMENKGFEFSINTQPVRTRTLSWDMNFNITYNKNTITNLTVIPNDKNYIGFPSTNINGSQGFAFLNAVGGSKNTFYLYKQVYDAKSGKPIEGLFVDKNRDGIINEDDKFKSKGADPKVFLGFSTNLSYKKWSAGFVVRASFDNYVYNNIFSNNGRLNSIIGGQTIGNASANYLTTLFKGTTDQQLLSDYYIENGSFLRMDNFNIGYNVGAINGSKVNLRVSANVQNVFVITKYKGLDPETSSGVDDNFYPRPRIFVLGFNFDF